MRLHSLVGFGVLSFVVLTMTGSDGQAQFGGFDLKNPDNFFSRYARAQGTTDELVIDKVQSRMDPEMSTKMKAYAAKVGIANGKLTKTQFADFWAKVAAPQMEERMKQRGFGGFRGQGPPNQGAPPSGPGPGSFGRGPGSPPPAAPSSGEKTATSATNQDSKTPQPTGFQPRPFDEGEAKSYFERMDEDRSKALDEHEYRRSDVRHALEKWDTNRNKLVEEPEWLAYMKNRHDEREQERRVREEEHRLFEEFKALRKARELVIPIGPIFPEKPVVIRADNLPEKLPTWFKELNTDGDAQISLVEWRAGEKESSEFRKQDRNADGLLTPNEVLWYTENADRLADLAPTGPSITTEKKPDDRGPRGFGGFGGFGGRTRNGGFPKRP